MRILLITAKSEESKGGIAVWTEHYLNGCAEAGIDCDIVNTAMIGKRAIYTTAKRNMKDEFIRTRGIMKQLNRLLRAGSYDAAHINTNVGALGIIRDYCIAANIAKRKIPIALHFHCDIPCCAVNSVIRFYLKKLLRLSAVNFVLCENSRLYLKNEFAAGSVPVSNFVEAESILDKKRIRKNIEKALFVGRVSVHKGVKEIYELARFFPNISFELIGEISKETAEWDKPENVELLGIKSHDEVISHLDNADVFIFPSHTEGFSLALAEAMARGVPAIAADVGANADMLGEGCGIIVPVGDVDALRKSLDTMKNPIVRQAASERSIKKAAEHYETSKVMKQLKNCYMSITEGTDDDI